MPDGSVSARCLRATAKIMQDSRQFGTRRFHLSVWPKKARCTSTTRLTAMLLRGTDRYRHFDDEPRPRVDFGDAERAAHADAVARLRASNAEQTRRYESAARAGRALRHGWRQSPAKSSVTRPRRSFFHDHFKATVDHAFSVKGHRVRVRL